MPIAKVQLPDGRIARFEVPDGTTPEQVLEFAQGQSIGQTAKKVAQPQPRTEEEPATKFGSDAPNTYFAARGGTDEPIVPEGTNQQLMNMIGNIPGDIKQTVIDMVSPLASPIQTAKGLGSFVKDMATSPEYRQQIYNAIGENIQGEGLAKNIENRPVASLSTMIGAAGAAGLGARGVAKAARVTSALPLIDDALSTINRLDPLNMAANSVLSGAAKVAKGGKRFTLEMAGKWTGKGPGFAERAANNSADFQRGMRATEEVTPKSIVADAEKLVGDLAKAKSAQFETDMAKVKAWNGALDTAEVDNKFNRLLDKYNLIGDYDDSGKFVVGQTARTDIPDASVAEIQQVFDEVQAWKSRVGNDMSPMTFHALKRKLDKIYTKNSDSRGFVADMRNEVKKTITDKVPEYGTAMKNYSKYIDLEDDVKGVLSLGRDKKANVDTAFKKLQSTLRQNFEGRKEVLDAVKQYGLDPDTVLDQVAGFQARDWTGSGLMGQMAAGAGAVSMTVEGARKMLMILPMTSPRITAGFLRSAGWTEKQIGKLFKNNGFKSLQKSYQAPAKRGAMLAINEMGQEGNK